MATLDDLLSEITVHEADEVAADNAADPNHPARLMPGWWGVCDEDGIIAWFANQTDAFAFRLFLINTRLNGRDIAERYTQHDVE